MSRAKPDLPYYVDDSDEYRSPTEDICLDYFDRMYEADEARALPRCRRRPLAVPPINTLSPWSSCSVGFRAYYAIRAMEEGDLVPYAFAVTLKASSPDPDFEARLWENLRFHADIRQKVEDVLGRPLPVLTVAKVAPDARQIMLHCCIGLEDDHQLDVFQYVLRCLFNSPRTETHPVKIIRDRLEWVLSSSSGTRTIIDFPGTTFLASTSDVIAAGRKIYRQDLAAAQKSKPRQSGLRSSRSAATVH